MTSITTHTGSYYQLNSQQNSPTGNTAGSATSLTQSLIASLNGASGISQDNANSNAYSLNLSPAAQLLMNNAGGASSSGGSFTLTQPEKKLVNDIISKYKDAPFNQDTYNQIQNDLSAAGLGANQLMARNEVGSLNLTSTLIDDLNGNINLSMINPSNTLSAEQTKSANYMQGIIKAWQSISTTANIAQN